MENNIQDNELAQEIASMIYTMEAIYQKNMLWLSKEHNDIFKSLQKEEKKIKENKNLESYSVELNMLGTLDILNKQTNLFSYNFDPFIFGDNKTNEIKEDKLKNILFDGTLLGTHIKEIIRKFQPKNVTVCEKDIQMFNCSLYVTDYVELSKLAKIQLSIASKCKVKDKYFIVKV